MGRECSTREKRRNACRVLVGKPKGNRLLGSSIRKWEDNNRICRIDRNMTGWYGLYSDGPGEVTVEGSYVHGGERLGSIK
jgi:hypothetical protein